MSAAPQQENPFQGFFQNVGNVVNAARNGANNLVQQIQNNPQVQQVENSPIGLAVQGKFNQVIPAVQKEFSAHSTIAGKPYNPQLAIGGEMEEVPGSGIEPATQNAKPVEYPYSKSPNPIQKAGLGQNQATRQIRLPNAGINGSQAESAVHDTLNRLGIKGSAQNQYAQLGPKMTELNNWIQNESSLSKNPQEVSIDEVKQNLLNQVQKQFPVGGPKGAAAQQAVNNYINEIYNAANQKPLPAENQPPPSATFTNGRSPVGQEPQTLNGVENPNVLQRTQTPSSILGPDGNPMMKTDFTPKNIVTPQTPAAPQYAYNNQGTAPYNPSQPEGNIIPDKIATPDIYKMKVEANKASSNIFKDTRTSPLSDLEKVTLAGRNAWDNIIAKYHPDVKQATMDMSRLYDATSSLEKARFNAPPTPDVMGSILPPAVEKYLMPPLASKGINKVLTSRAGLTTLGATAAGAGLAGAGYLLGKGKQQTNAGSTTPQVPNTSSASNPVNSYLGVKPDQTGHFAVDTQPQPNPVYMTNADRLAQEKAISPYDPAYSNKVSQIERQFQAGQEQAKNALAGEKLTFMSQNGAPALVSLGNQVADSLRDPNFLSVINNLKTPAAIKEYMSNPNNPYSQQVADLSAMNVGFTGAVRMITGEKLNPGDAQLIQPGMSREQLLEKLNRMQQFVVGSYNENLAPYLALTSPTGANNNQGQPIPANIPSSPPATGSTDASSIVGGAPPPLQFPGQ